MDKLEEATAITQYFAEKCDLPWTRMFIAGGWAANPFRSNDIDIWVYRPECVISDDYYKKLGNLIFGATQYELANGDFDGFGKPHTYLEWYGKSIQIFETPYDVFELLELFDLSCHQYAITHDGVYILGENATHPVDEPIVVLTPDHSTPHRLLKVQERYGHD